MSRNSRLGRSHRNDMFSVAHHQQYAASSTYFPRSYSYIGKDIYFPKQVLSFFAHNKINGVGTIEEIRKKLSKIEANLWDVKAVFLSINGKKCQGSSTCMNVFTFCSTILFFCFLPIMKSSCYRNRFFTKYTFDQYDELLEIINKFKNSKILVINFQDNNLTQQKIACLDRDISKKAFKVVVLRNMTYFMEVEGIKDSFPLLRNKKDTDFKFIWEQFIIVSNHNSDKVGNINHSHSQRDVNFQIQ